MKYTEYDDNNDDSISIIQVIAPREDNYAWSRIICHVSFMDFARCILVAIRAPDFQPRWCKHFLLDKSIGKSSHLASIPCEIGWVDFEVSWGVEQHMLRSPSMNQNFEANPSGTSLNQNEQTRLKKKLDYKLH